MTRSYGGKEGVWLKRKRRKLSSSLFSYSSRYQHGKTPSTASIGAFSHSLATGSTNIDHPGNKGHELGSVSTSAEIKHKSSVQTPLLMVIATTRMTMSRIKQATLFKQRGSHFGGVIPKKYLLLQEQQQRQRQRQQHITGHHYHHHNHCAPDNIDIASPDTTSTQPDQLRLNSRNHRSSDKNLKRKHGNIHNYNAVYTPTSPKPGQLIGWDSKKCRPIYSLQLQNNGNDDDDDDSYSINNDSDGDYDDNYDDNGNTDADVKMDKPKRATSNVQDNTLWNDALEQMSQNYDRRRKANAKNRRKYTSSSLCGMKKRRGLMSMPLSVFERVESPQNKHNYQITSAAIDNGNVNVKSNVSSIKIKKTLLTKECRLKCNPVRKLLKFNREAREDSQKESSPLPPSHMSSMNNNPRARSISFALNSDVSKVHEHVEFTRPKSTRLKGSTDKSSPREDECFQDGATSTSPFSSPISACMLQFVNDFDENNNETTNTKLSKKRKKTKVGQKRGRRQEVGKAKENTRALNQDRNEENRRKTYDSIERERKTDKDYGKDKKSHSEEDIGCYTVTQLSQISSSTSLCVAKAFFQQLDSYEMTMA